MSGEIGSKGFLTRRSRNQLTLLYDLARRRREEGLEELMNMISTLACVASFEI